MDDAKLICTLQHQRAIDLIAGTMRVFYRHGVWNKYRKIPTEKAIEFIKRSGYGADIYQDSSGQFYVSVPCDSDMW